MEKNKKNQETPLWVKVISELPPASQQVIGQIAASVVQNLAVLDIVSRPLVVSLFQEVTKPVNVSTPEQDADAFVEELVKDAQNGKL